MSKNTFVQIYIYIYDMNSPKYKIDDLRQSINYFLFFVPVSLNRRSIIVPVLTYVDRAWPDVGRGLWRWWLDVMRVSSIPSKKQNKPLSIIAPKRIVWVESRNVKPVPKFPSSSILLFVVRNDILRYILFVTLLLLPPSTHYSTTHPSKWRKYIVTSITA